MYKVIRLIIARSCLLIFLSEYKNIEEACYFVLLASIANISLKLNDKNIEDLHNQLNEFRTNLLKLLRSESL